ncbi:MAG: GntR family transcriptional regulator [Armatimonadota bacterium]
MQRFQIGLKYRDLGLPKYMQVKYSLKSAIDKGMFGLGDKLPSIQQMAGEFKVSYITMRQAIHALEEDGHVKSIHGHGTFVADSLPESAQTGIKKVKVVIPGRHSSLPLSELYKSGSNHTTEILHCIGDRMCGSGIEVTLESSVDISDVLDDETDGYCLISIRRSFLPKLTELAHSGYRFVVINSSWPGQKDFVCVDSNNYESARKAVEFAYKLGHRKIGFVSNFQLPCDINNSNDRFQGYKDALADLGIPYSDKWVIMPDYIPSNPSEPTNLYETVLEHLKRTDSATALFAGGLFEAGYVYQAAGSLGIKIPEQLSVIGFDDFASAAFYQPPLTTFRQPLYEMVKVAHDYLTKMTAGEKVKKGNIFIPCTLVQRNSAGEFRVT